MGEIGVSFLYPEDFVLINYFFILFPYLESCLISPKPFPIQGSPYFEAQITFHFLWGVTVAHAASPF